MASGSDAPAGRGVRRSIINESIAAHFTYFMTALDLEFQEEWKESEERLKWDKKRLQVSASFFKIK